MILLIIYNEDETGIQFVCKSPKKVKSIYMPEKVENAVERKYSNVFKCSWFRDHPAFLIFKGLSFSSDLHIECFPENTIFSHSKSGYMVIKLFTAWLKIFVENIPPKCPVLLLLNGHVSHVSLNAIEFAKDNEIIMLCFPPYTIHLCLPMDNGPNLNLKKAFIDEANKRMRKIKTRLKNENFGTSKHGNKHVQKWRCNPDSLRRELLHEREEDSSKVDCSTTSIDTTLDSCQQIYLVQVHRFSKTCHPVLFQDHLPLTSKQKNLQASKQ